MAMKLESLTNELLFVLFDYMSLGQILYSFQSLNSRSNQRTFVYQRTILYLDLDWSSKFSKMKYRWDNFFTTTDYCLWKN